MDKMLGDGRQSTYSILCWIITLSRGSSNINKKKIILVEKLIPALLTLTYDVLVHLSIHNKKLNDLIWWHPPFNKNQLPITASIVKVTFRALTSVWLIRQTNYEICVVSWTYTVPMPLGLPQHWLTDCSSFLKFNYLLFYIHLKIVSITYIYICTEVYDQKEMTTLYPMFLPDRAIAGIPCQNQRWPQEKEKKGPILPFLFQGCRHTDTVQA